MSYFVGTPSRPVLEQWHEDNARRENGGLPPRGFCAFASTICCGAKPTHEDDEMGGLTPAAMDALLSARGSVVAFNTVSERTGFLLRQQLQFATRIDAQLRNMAKWSTGDVSCCPAAITTAHTATCQAIKEVCADAAGTSCSKHSMAGTQCDASTHSAMKPGLDV